MTALPAPPRLRQRAAAPTAPAPGSRLRFIDLCAGLGGFHAGLSALGHECVFASEINKELREVYEANFPGMKGKVHGDIREAKRLVPDHDVLCAGFPCQPFSKSGHQHGFKDPTDGTIFHEVLEIIDAKSPYYVFLENVGNFERHDGGNTWKVVKEALQERGYDVRGTEHASTGGHGLVSPHHLGHPQHRERFFVVASRGKLPDDPFPPVRRKRETAFDGYLLEESDLTEDERAETALTQQQKDCINHWNKMLAKVPKEEQVLTPLWGDEFAARYPYELAKDQPFNIPSWALEAYLGKRAKGLSKAEMLELLPNYAREEAKFKDWKVEFIRTSRAWWQSHRSDAPEGWRQRLQSDHFPFSLRKLEFHCGEERDLWNCVLQFRPSGLRAKRMGQIPALVAMTSTQVPIIGPKRRFLTRREGLLLQGFPSTFRVPKNRADAFAALGNAVHVKVVEEIGRRFIGQTTVAATPLATAH